MQTILPDFYRGDSVAVELTYTTSETADDGTITTSATDITGSVIYFSMSRIGSGGIVILAFNIDSFTDAVNGKHDFALTSAQTKGLRPGRYSYDFRRVDSSGAVETVKGVCAVLQPVTVI